MIRDSIHKWNAFDTALFQWAIDHRVNVALELDAAIDAHDDGNSLRILGLIAQEMFYHDCTRWFHLVATHPREALSLSKWIGTLYVFGYPHPRRPEEWPEWIEGIRYAHQVSDTAKLFRI